MIAIHLRHVLMNEEEVNNELIDTVDEEMYPILEHVRSLNNASTCILYVSTERER